MQWGGLGQGGMNSNLPGVKEVRRMRGRLSLVLEDTEFGKVYDQTVILRLAQYLKPHWKMTLVSLVAMLLYIGTQIAVPVLVGEAIDPVLAGSRPLRAGAGVRAARDWLDVRRDSRPQPGGELHPPARSGQGQHVCAVPAAQRHARPSPATLHPILRPQRGGEADEPRPRTTPRPSRSS